MGCEIAVLMLALQVCCLCLFDLPVWVIDPCRFAFLGDLGFYSLRLVSADFGLLCFLVVLFYRLVVLRLV